MHYPEITINTDGGARGNPGPAAIGITAKAGSETLFELSEYIGQQTNNVAEYTAVIHALHHLNEHQVTADNCFFVLDSELIIRQIVGQYRVKEAHLQTLVAEVHRLVKEIKAKGILKKITFRHVKRHENKRADQLVNQALDSLK
ncbi:MAG: ribonuclease HI family protein [Patescibacteria group bacterium]